MVISMGSLQMCAMDENQFKNVRNHIRKRNLQITWIMGQECVGIGNGDNRICILSK